MVGDGSRSIVPERTSSIHTDHHDRTGAQCSSASGEITGRDASDRCYLPDEHDGLEVRITRIEDGLAAASGSGSGKIADSSGGSERGRATT